MRILHAVSGVVLMTAVVAGPTNVHAQDFPVKPVRIVTAPPGGSTDLLSRLIGQAIAGPLGQQVIIDNRPVILLGESVAKAAPDGYTLVLVADTHWLYPLMRKMPYDPVKDFEPVSTVATQPNVLVVHPSLPVRSVKELIALAKARPGQLNYATGATGSMTHIAAELFKSMAGVDIVNIPFGGSGPAVVAIISGELQLLFFVTGSAAPHLRSGRLRGLAVATPRPTPLAPGLPTMSESGLPGFEIVSKNAVFAPARTPAAAIRRLNQEMVRAVNSQEVKDRLFAASIEGLGSTPEQLAATVAAEMTRLGKVIKDSNIRAD